MHNTCAPPGITWSAECACGGRRAPWLHMDHDGSWCRSDRMHCMFNVGVWWVRLSTMDHLVIRMDPTAQPPGTRSIKLG